MRGVFEHMVKLAKCRLKKAIGRNCLTYNDLLTLVTEVEAVLNPRSLSRISSEEVEEPITPSYLLIGFRIMTLPDPSTPSNDPHFPSRFEGLERRTTSLGVECKFCNAPGVISSTRTIQTKTGLHMDMYRKRGNFHAYKILNL